MSSIPSRLEIIAPLSGVLVPLSSVPDPVFAEKMVGDGVSLDPTSPLLLAPVAGVVTLLHTANHALTITTGSGIEVLVHIGLDSVMLKGEGFTPKVKQGESVEVGQPLIAFDADLIACKARSLLTQILIANGEKVLSMTPAGGLVEAGKSIILSLDLADDAPQEKVAPAEGSEAVFSGSVELPNPAGLHARPAAVLATKAKKFKSDIQLVRGDDMANAKSLVAIMGLSTKQHDAIKVKAWGSDATEAVAEIAKMLADGCGEKPGEVNPIAPAEVLPPSTEPRDASVLSGVSASPGLAVGRVVQFRRETIDVLEAGEGADHETAKFDAALHEAQQQIEALKGRLADASKAKILDAHQEMLEDPELIALARKGVSDSKSAAFAWRAAFTFHADQLEKLDNPLLRERANDIRDVGRRVLALLAGVQQGQIETPEGSILIAEELTPSETTSLDRSKVLGFCTTTGGPNGHVAILARSLAIPAICGIDHRALSLETGSQVILDGGKGTLRMHPSDDELAQAQKRMADQTARREREIAAAGAPAVTTDGHRIRVVANVTNGEETREALALGGEGVGLLRSEFLFLNRDTAPTEEEQASGYKDVAEVLGRDRPLVIRTLDVGGDKPLSYLPLPKEDNPFLGLRGVRVSLDQPDLFRTQLRAILQAAPIGDLHIMFPMIASLDELRTAKQILAEEQLASGQSAKVGIMIEVPAAAIMADHFAREADFFSIGTNDLTQYTLAMDRGHPKLAKQADALHPAVLSLIRTTIDAAHKHQKWVGICGGIASDVLAVPVLIGLGVDELSVSVPAIPAVKARICLLTMSTCQAIAQEVLQMGTASEVRLRLASFADQLISEGGE
ncbi:MAG: phosphoenolpyruvate--protein phosphotransferase [Pseudomonadota bacterium]